MELFSDCHTEEEINRKHRCLSARYHPDKGGGAGLMQQINTSRETALRRARQSGQIVPPCEDSSIGLFSRLLYFFSGNGS